MSTQNHEHRTTSTNINPAELPEHVTRVDEAFDNTSLLQAHGEGIVSDRIPPHFEDIEPHVDPDQANFLENPQARPEAKKKRRGLLIGVGAGAAALAVAGGAFFGLKAVNDGGHGSTPDKDPKATSQTTPEATPADQGPTTSYKDPHVFDFPLTATTDQLAANWAALVTASAAGNLTQQTYDAHYGNAISDKWAGMSSDEFTSTAAQMNVDALASAQFISGWQNNPDLKLQHDVWIAANKSFVNNWILGAKPQVSFTVDSVKVLQQTADEETLEISLSQHMSDTDPRDGANVSKLNGAKEVDHVTFKKSTDRFLIADVQGVSTTLGPNATK